MKPPAVPAVPPAHAPIRFPRACRSFTDPTGRPTRFHWTCRLLQCGGALGLALALQACSGGGGGDSADTDSAGATPSANGTLVEDAAYLKLAASINRSQTDQGTAIETFNGQDQRPGSAPAGWAFEQGVEFPGASGNLVLTPPDPAPNLVANLAADLGCNGSEVRLAPVTGCGLYVAMSRTLNPRLSAPAADKAIVTLEIQTTHPLLSTGLRVVDHGGQVHQYPYLARSLENHTGSGWSRVSVPIGISASHWGGANDGRLHGGIAALSLTAGAATLTGPASNLKVRDIRLLPSGASQLALSRQSTVLSDGVLPSLKGRLAVASHFDQLSDTALSQAAAAGATVLRMDLFWTMAEANRRFDFRYYDGVLKQLEKHGLSALFILDYAHPDHGGGSPTSAGDRAAYAEFARQAALFAVGRNVTAFEIWNEPDNTRFWSQGDPQSYALLLGEARSAIRSVDPARQVLNGGVSWVNLPYILNLAKTGQLSQVDAFAVHPYRSTAPETFAADLASIKAVLASQGVTRPVWSTESGYPSVGRFDQAQYGNGHDTRARRRQAVLALRTVLTQVSLNLPLLTLYELNDSGTDPQNPEHNYGLLTPGGQPKPAYTALKTLNQVTSTRRYAGLLKDVPPHVHAMRWDGPNDTLFAVWVDSPDHSLTLTLPKVATAMSWDASDQALAAGPNASARQLSLSEAGGPVFVRFPNSVE